MRVERARPAALLEEDLVLGRGEAGHEGGGAAVKPLKGDPARAAASERGKLPHINSCGSRKDEGGREKNARSLRFRSQVGRDSFCEGPIRRGLGGECKHCPAGRRERTYSERRSSILLSI